VVDGEESSKLKDRRPLGVLALGAAIALVRLALPVGVGLFLGVLLAFTLQPVYRRLRAHRLGAGPAALVCALGATAIITAGVAAMTTLFITRGVALVSALPGLLAPGGSLRTFAERSLAKLAALHVDTAALTTKLEEQAMSLGSRAANAAAGLAGATFGALLTLFFMTLATFFVLRRWNDVVERAEEILPFEPRHTRALLDQFQSVGRQVLRGTVVTGLVQGVLAAFGYWITGVPDPAFYGALTGVASLAPAVGTLLVWVPLCVYLLVTGHVGAGVVCVLYSIVVVGIVPDYVIRPWLVGRDGGVPAVLTFISLFGGVEVFGLVGLILGPVIVTLSIAILRTYHAEIARAGASHE
jgi:predicted PurR-regulated permease PerM